MGIEDARHASAGTCPSSRTVGGDAAACGLTRRSFVKLASAGLAAASMATGAATSLAPRAARADDA